METNLTINNTTNNKESITTTTTTSPSSFSININNPPTDVAVAVESPRSFIFETRLERASQLREVGTSQYRQGQYEEALKSYQRALYHVDFDELSYNFELQDDHRSLVDHIRVPLWVNTSTTLLKLGKTSEALEQVELALKTDPKFVKGLYRRGQIRIKMNDYDRALKDFESILKIDPTNIDANQEIIQIKKELKRIDDQTKQIWKGKLDTSTTTTSNNNNNKSVSTTTTSNGNNSNLLETCTNRLKDCFHKLCSRRTKNNNTKLQ
jgi:tetratricopeptide (TPR) repeat protein